MKIKFPDGFYDKHKDEILEKIFALSKSSIRLEGESKRKLQGFLGYLYEKDLEEEEEERKKR